MIADEVVRAFAEGEYRPAGAVKRDGLYRYRLLAPASRSNSVRYPLVVFLHGAGERGSDNRAQLKYLPAWMAAPDMRAKYPCYLLAPQCPSEMSWSSRPAPERPLEPLQVVIDVVAQLEMQEAIDLDRVYLTGLSMGGFGAWDLAARLPERFAALVPICGGGEPEQAQRILPIPTWVFHGAEDAIVPVAESRVMVAALRHLGGQPRYTEFTHVAHDSWTPAYCGNPTQERFEGEDPQSLLDWMFSQRRPSR